MKTRKRVQISFSKPSRTKQAFKDECDINRIMAKYEKTRMLTHVNRTQGVYGDFSNVNDYQSSLQAVMDANDSFLDLPASIRKRFQNDPTQFIDFVTDPSNLKEAAKMGLLTPEKTKELLSSPVPSSSPSSPSNPSPKPKDDPND